MKVRSSFLIALLLHSLPAFAQLSDGNADARHFFPLFMDGGGFRSRLILTNAAHTSNQCVVDFGGQGLNAGVFEPDAALTASGAAAAVALPAGIGANVSLVSRGERARAAFGYAQLKCEAPVLAGVLLTTGDGGAVDAMTVLEGAPHAAAFRFPVLPRLGPLSLVIANEGNTFVSCEIGLEAFDGRHAGGGIVGVFSRSAQMEFFDELVEIPEGFDGGPATVSCDAAVSAALLQMSGGAFAAIPPVVEAYVAGRADIPDAGLRTALAAALGREDAGDAPELTEAEIENLRVLNAISRGIGSLAGLESAVNLSHIYIGDNEISDLSALADLTDLIDLRLGGNAISDITPIAGLTGLNTLILSRNNLSDISPLSALTALTYLELNLNSISEISALSGLINLNNLHLSENMISDVSALSTLTGLTFLYLGRNSIADISAVSGLTALKTLQLHGNEISDISALSGLTGLTQLTLNENNISDIAALSGLTGLTLLNMGVNPISDIAALSGLTGLRELYMSENSVSDISALSGMSDLSVLWLADNQIESIATLTALNNLTVVGLSGNPLDDESVNTHIPALRERGVEVYFP